MTNQTIGGLGTPPYMAPEQYESARDVKPSADVWGLGVTLYQLLTATLPWSADSIFALWEKIKNQPPPDPKQWCPELSAGIIAILHKALQKQPESRYADCREMADALEQHLESFKQTETRLADPDAGSLSPSSERVTSPPAETLIVIADELKIERATGGPAVPPQEPPQRDRANQTPGRRPNWFRHLLKILSKPIALVAELVTIVVGVIAIIIYLNPKHPKPWIELQRPIEGQSLAKRKVEVSGMVRGLDTAYVFVNGNRFPLNQSGGFSLEIGLTNEGKNVIEIQAVSRNLTLTKKVSVEIDTRKPVITIDTPRQSPYYTNRDEIRVSGRVEDTHLSTVEVNGKAPGFKDGRFEDKIPLSQDGEYSVHVVARDECKHTSRVAVTIVRDTKRPKLLVTNLDRFTGGHLTNVREQHIRGEVRDVHFQVLTLNGKPVKSSNGTFDIPWNLQEGENTATLIAIDKAGNTATQTLTVTLDTVPPQLEVKRWQVVDTSGLSQIAATARHEIVVNASEPLDRIEIDGLQIPQTGKNLILPVTVPKPAQKFELTAYDRAGNSSNATVTVAWKEFTDSNGIGFVYIREERASNQGRPAAKRIRGPFFMGVTEVTREQWKKVMGKGKCKEEWEKSQDNNLPANYVSWNDTRDFVRNLGRKKKATYRLPTEAEWKYACLAGNEGPYGFPKDEQLARYAWYEVSSKVEGKPTLHPVKGKKANMFGLYDMHGNVSEWCWDAIPSVISEAQRIHRGGAYYYPEFGDITQANEKSRVGWLQVGTRFKQSTGYSGRDVGVRVVRSLEDRP